MESVKSRILWFTHTKAGYDKVIKNTNNVPTTGTWVESIANKFKNDNEVQLAIAFHSENKDEILTKDGIKYYPIYIKTSKNKVTRFLNKAKNNVSWYNEIEDYKKVIKDFRPDLIHVFGTEENFGFISKFTKTPVVLSIQGNLTVYQWKYFSGLTKYQLFSSFNFNNFIRFSTALSKYKKFKKKALREQEILKEIKNIIGRTDWDKRISKVLSPNSKYYYNDEILRNQFYNEPIVEPIFKKKLMITTMSGPSVYKGLETVCMAITILNELKMDFIWNIGGVDKSDNLIKAIKKKLGKKYPDKNLNFMGRLNEIEIIKLLKKTNIYVLPSHIENSPLTLSEAMILGLPIVSSFAGGICSRLEDKKEGLLIQSGDPWSLAGAILELNENHEQALIYGRNAKKRAFKRHDPEKIIKELKNIYRDILLVKEK